MIQNRYLIILSFLYLILVLAVSNFFPFERGITYDDDYQRCLQTVTKRFELSEEEYFDLRTSPYFSVCYNSAYGDEIEYIAMAANLTSFEPYSLRPLFPKIIGYLVSSFVAYEDNKVDFFAGLYVANLLVNIFLLCVGSYVTFLTLINLTSNVFLKTVLPLIFVVNVGVIQTVNFFMLDVASYCFAAFAMYLTSKRNFLGLALAIGLGVLVKEVLIIYTICFIFLFYEKRSFLLKHLPLSILPILTFIILRLLSNVDPLSMQHGWNISEGEISLHYLTAHLKWGGIPFLIKVFSALGFPILILLSYYKNFKDYKFYIFLCLTMILLIIFANLLLASRVPRVVFIVYPFIAFIIATISNNKNQRSFNSSPSK
jgi:hypothetical protein